MLTVNILINGQAIYARTVVNRLREKGAYVCDDGTLIKHNPKDGAVVLAIKALQTIQEDPDKEYTNGNKERAMMTQKIRKASSSETRALGTANHQSLLPPLQQNPIVIRLLKSQIADKFERIDRHTIPPTVKTPYEEKF